MIKSFSFYCVLLISAGIFSSAIYFKDYYRDIILSAEQDFLLKNTDRTSQSKWKNYLAHDLEINKISEEVLQIVIKEVPSESAQSLIEKLQQIKYAKLHNINFLADISTKVFEITVVISFPQNM